tara:strand:+ start:154 stop:474 length:321 start_codon:yes stop_codon:yes gene_type:complete
MNDNYMDALSVYAGTDNHYACGCDEDGKIINLDWYADNPKPKPTTAQLDAIIVTIKAEYDSQDYARKRKAEYDQLNQYEMMFDDKRDGTTTWVDKINEIKSRYPKG